MSTEKLKKLLADLRPKFPWRDLAAVLRDAGISVGSGWDKLEKRLEDADPVEAAKVEKTLSKLHDGTLVAGTKEVFVFELDESFSTSIASAFGALTPSVGTFTDAYPFGLPANTLKGLSNEHEMVSTVRSASGATSILLAAKRTTEERDTYAIEQVTTAVRQAFAGYDEFIAVRKLNYQVMDVVTVRPRLKRLEVLVDFPELIRAPETAEARCLVILGRLGMLVPEVQAIYQANAPVNLIKCISGLYHAPTEGRVTRLSFRAPSGSVNKGLVGTMTDLRTDPFHSHGVKGVGTVNPYDVTITWDRLPGVEGHVGVQVGMPISGLSADDADVRSARIIAARSDAAVTTVVNKLVSYSTG